MTPEEEIAAAFAAGRAPAALGYRMPAETARHAGCWMAWPSDPESWRDVEAVEAAVCAVANAIAAFEPVSIAVHPESRRYAEAYRRDGLLSGDVRLVSLPQGGVWMRDVGPSFVRAAGLPRVAVDLGFNGWGDKVWAPRVDRQVAARVAKRESAPRYVAGLHAEGGAIHVDGDGTLVTTESCLLNPNRNPGMTKAEIERRLQAALGVEKVVWLPGDPDERITDGHIDGVMMFVRPGVTLFDTTPDRDDPRYPVVAENLRALQLATDAHGRRFEIGMLEEAHDAPMDGPDFARTFVNSYLANGAVIAPRFGGATDAAAHEVFARAFPDRAIRQVDIRAIAPGGGGIHCITQQVPA